MHPFHSLPSLTLLTKPDQKILAYLHVYLSRVSVIFVLFVCAKNLPPSIVFVFVPATSAKQACMDKNVTL